MSVKVTGFDVAAKKLDAAADVLAGREPDAVFLRAGEHVAERMSQVVGTASPYRESGLTAADIEARVTESDRDGITVEVGAPERSIVLAHLEFGTSTSPAYPLMRPAYESQKGAMRTTVLQGLRKILPMLTR